MPHIAHDVTFMGGEAALDYVTMLGDSSSGESFLALARLKLTLQQVSAAMRSGNCGAAGEQLALAWQQFSQYAPLATHIGQTSYATTMFKSIAAWESKLARSCSVGNNPGGMLGAFDMGTIKASFTEHKKTWLIGGGVAAAALVALMVLKKG